MLRLVQQQNEGKLISVNKLHSAVKFDNYLIIKAREKNLIHNTLFLKLEKKNTYYSSRTYKKLTYFKSSYLAITVS